MDASEEKAYRGLWHLVAYVSVSTGVGFLTEAGYGFLLFGVIIIFATALNSTGDTDAGR